MNISLLSGTILLPAELELVPVFDLPPSPHTDTQALTYEDTHTQTVTPKKYKK